MPILHTHITQFRNLKCVEIEEFSLKINVLYGENGSGKTSLLESCYYLSLGRSFRTHDKQPLITRDHDQCTVFASLENNSINELPHHAGFLRHQNGAHHFRLNDQTYRSALKITEFFPLHFIDSEAHQLLEGPPSERRSFLNWGLFYHDPSFMECWKRYERSLKQRNTLLKHCAPQSELYAWTEELAQHGLEFNAYRKRYILAWKPLFSTIVSQLLPQFTFSIRYDAGWDEEYDLKSALLSALSDEQRLGVTLRGPHRADLLIETHDQEARHHLSRGQQKLLVYAMILAQGQLLEQTHTHRMTYLIDDLSSELDVENQRNILRLFMQQNAQMLITAIDIHHIESVLSHSNAPIKMFHVKHGEINPVHSGIFH